MIVLFEIFLKKDVASLLITLGSSNSLPFTSMDAIEFFLLLFVATVWKNLVFRSPSLSHEILEFCTQYNSLRFIHFHNSDCAALLSFNLLESRFRWLDISSRRWIEFFNFEILLSMLPNSSWFHILSLFISAFNFSFVGNKGFRPQTFCSLWTCKGQWSGSPHFNRVTLRPGNNVSHSGLIKSLSRRLLELPLNHVNPPVEDGISNRCVSLAQIFWTC